MSLSSMFTNRVMKVNLDGEIVRVNLEVPPSANEQEVFALMQSGVQQAFALSDDQIIGLTLKYTDEDGDLCTLTQASLSDLAAQMPEGILRLTASLAPLRNTAPTSSDQAEPANMETEAEGMEQQRGASTSSQPGAFHPIAQLAVQFLPMWLPAVSAKLQAAEKRAELNRVGIEERTKVLPICKRLRDSMGSVPEAAHLQAKLSCYIDGSDAEHLGDLAAELLQAFARSSSQEGVKAVVQDLIACIMEANLQPGLGSNFAGMFPTKGHGKGTNPQAEAAPPMPDINEQGNPVPPAMPDITAMLGGLLGGKGAGKSSSDVPAACALGALGGLLAGKGVGKGAPGQPNMADAVGPLMQLFSGKGYGKGAPEPGANSAAPTSTSTATFEQEVRDLMDMGLIGDEQVGRDLLRANNGDLSKVVDILTQ